MHAVAAFLASIITFVSGFFAPTVASNSPVDIRTTQPAAAAAAQAEITGDPFNDPAAASAAAPAPALSASPPQTVINQPVIERIIERIVPQSAVNVSTDTLSAILTDFEQSISNRIAAINPPKAGIIEPVAAAGIATGAYFPPASQRIDQLTNTVIKTPTITGGTISGVSSVGATSGSFDVLSAGTLNLSGTLSGADISLSGTLTAGAVFAPYFSATSTTATSTFVGPVAFTAIPWGLLSTDGSGNIVATSTPTAASFIATSTIASQFPYASSTALSVSGTGFFGTLSLPSFTHTILSTNGTGQVVATTSIGMNYLSGILPVANGGTATSTQVTNGVNYYDGIKITSGTALTFNGTALGTPLFNATQTSGTSTIAAGQGFSIGASQFVVQQGSGNVGIGTTSPAYALDVNGDVNVASGKCFRVAGTCIGYVVKLAAIYATSTPSTTTDDVSVVFTGAPGSSPSYAAGTLTLPSNASYIVTEVWGGGGGGGGSSTGYGGGGGGAGYSQKVYTTLAATYFYNIGKGGAGGAASDTGTGDGAAGAASSFGTGLATSTANGGGAGWHGAISVAGVGGAGGAASGGDVNLTGGGGGNAYLTSGGAFFGGFGGSAPRGGGGGRTYPGATNNGEVGAAFGGGGGGGITPGAGGAGGSGGLVITVYATSSPNAAGNDYAENFPVSDPGITAGDIVSVDTGIPVSMRYARKGDTTLAGIISTQPGQLLGDKDAVGMRPVALAGRVPTKVSMENGSIALGDRIAVSSTPGVGMKAGPFDDAVGIALESASQDGSIMVFVTLSRGIDINAIAMTLLGNETPPFESPTVSTTSTAIGPIDFVGGMMSAIASRIILADGTSTATNFSLTDSYTGSFLHSIFGRLIAWFADATNGIHDFYAGIIHSQEDHTQKLCIAKSDGTPVCVNGDQLGALLASARQSADSPSTAAPSATSQAPVIELNGKTTSTIGVGDTYNDLGARIVAPESDLNLGIVILLDGSTTTTISLDTSTPGEHIILYTVTSPSSGLTGSVMRTVIISPATQQRAPAEDANPFNAPEPTNDNTSSTDVLLAS